MACQKLFSETMSPHYVQKIGRILRIFGHRAQEGSALLAPKQRRSEALQWNSPEDFTNCPPARKGLAESTSGLSLPVQGHSSHCFWTVACGATYGEETAWQAPSCWILQRPTYRGLLAAVAERQGCPCKTSTERVCRQDKSSHVKRHRRGRQSARQQGQE